MTRRRVALAIALTLLLVLALSTIPAVGDQLGSDPFRDLTGGEAAGFMGRYPLTAYSLDTHIDTNDVLGVTVPGNATMEAFAFGLASIIWLITSIAVKLTISFVVLAFSLDILNPHGALAPIADAVQHLYQQVLGDPFMELMIVLLGGTLAYKAIWKRRHTEAIGQLALSFAYIFIALTLIFRPADTIGQVASLTNQASSAFLTATASGTTGQAQSKVSIGDSLWRANGYYPWVALEFGALRHCVDTTHLDAGGYPRPVAANDPNRTVCRDHVRQIDGMGGYAIRFLRTHGAVRDREYTVLRDGHLPAGPFVYPQFEDGYRVDKSDSPAVDMMQQGKGYWRLGMAVMIGLCSAMFCIIFGVTALAVILTQVLALFMYAFAPIALGAAAIPGRGHRIFESWGLKLIGIIVLKAFFSFVLTALNTISIAFISAVGSQGWLLSFGLLAALYFVILWKRNWLMSMVSRGATRSEVRHTERTIRSTSERAVAAGAIALGAPLVATRAMLGGRQERSAGDPQQRSTPTSDLREVEHQPPTPEEQREATYRQRWDEVPDSPSVAAAEAATMSGQPTAAAVSSEAQGPIDVTQAGPGPVPSPEGARPATPAAPPATTPQVAPPPVPGLPPGDGRPLGKPHQPPEPPFPGVNTPESMVGPQRRAQQVPDLAPPPEYKGP